MAYGKYVHKAALGAVAILAWHSISWLTYETFDQPVPSIVFALLLCGAVLRLAERFVSRDFGILQKSETENVAAEYENESDDESISQETIARRFSQPPSLEPRSRRRVFLVVVVCVVLRIETVRRIAEHFECTVKNLEIVLLPLMLAIYEFSYIENSHDMRGESDIMWGSLFMDIYLAVIPFRARFLIPTFVFSLGVFLKSTDQLPSTYICPSEGILAYSGVISQCIGVILDFVILLGTWQLLSSSHDERRKLGIFGAISLSSAILLSILSILYLLYSSFGELRLASIALVSIWPIIKDGTTLAVALICFVYFISEVRLLVLIMGLVFIWMYTSSIRGLKTNFSPFPPQSKGAEMVGLLLLFLGFTTFMHISSTTERPGTSRNFAKRVPVWFYGLLSISFFVIQIIYVLKPSVAGFHPIDILKYNAGIDANRWLVHASSSTSLEAAVAEYHSRYRGRAPPPNFDKWYQFAIDRGCPVIDNYDQIDRDLLPLWAIPPAKIRERSPLQLPSNDIFAVGIRNGHVETSPFLHEEWQWPNETVKMIENFSQWLPDMYIAFNSRDTPRIAVSWKQIHDLTERASTAYGSLESGKDHGFTLSHESPSNWPSIDNDYSASEMYKSYVTKMHKSSRAPSFPSVFQRRVAPTCPPGSLSRRSRALHAQEFCANCAYPHSLGQFLHDWTLSGDLCHQPDMANLQGFLMSPGNTLEVGFSPDELVPIFSRSKISGYNDILFPGPWDFANVDEPIPNEKIFSELSNALLWRGEGAYESVSQSWRGHTPQRLAYISNNVNSSQSVIMLLPAAEAKKFRYEKVPVMELAGLLDLDVALAECETCSSDDYLEQERKISVKPAMEEREILQYRYLFLPGGPGESSRLMKYLLSNSVPFRSSIFRYWYDDRLTPWLHYVPIDERLQSVHSTLAYFTGLMGKINGRDIDLPQRFSEANFIADQGRKWAEKALRREDAEVYLFRLLLEYGRVTDDRRDDIGFQLET